MMPKRIVIFLRRGNDIYIRIEAKVAERASVATLASRRYQYNE
jgi:hypothetical protein